MQLTTNKSQPEQVRIQHALLGKMSACLQVEFSYSGLASGHKV